MLRIKTKKTAVLLAICLILSGSIINNNVYAYSGELAANYAKQHAKNYSSEFDSFNADCTNFASQCVYAGGIKMNSLPSDKVSYGNLGDVYKTKEYWSSKKYTKSLSIFGAKLTTKTDFVTTSTWSVVAKNTNDSFWGFFNYMNKHGASCREFSVNTTAKLNSFLACCQVGNVLQIRTATDTNKTHSVIVTDKTYDYKNKRYDIKIAYHTTDTAPVDFRTVSWQKFGPNTLWTIIDVSTVK